MSSYCVCGDRNRNVGAMFLAKISIVSMFIICCFFTLEYMATIDFHCTATSRTSFPPVKLRMVTGIKEMSPEPPSI